MDKPTIIDLPKFLDSRGNLSFIEEFKQIPFKIQRTYWIYAVPGGEHRGGHAYRENQEFIVALSGSLPSHRLMLGSHSLFHSELINLT